MIELENAGKNYGSFPALRNISFHVLKNETVGLLGRNGAGKTTLLNLITGYFPPTGGKVRICGRSMAEEPAACKRMIGYLPEKPPLYDEMTTESYLRFVCELREVKKKGIRDHVEEILSLCGLQEVRRRPLGHLSKGYRQRAGIAQALCGAPEILILDEPTVGLDPEQTAEIRELICRLSAEHTVLFSSHILSEVQQVCTRVIILDEGVMALDYDAAKPAGELIRLRLEVAGEAEAVLGKLRQMQGVLNAEKLREGAADSGVVEVRLTLERGGDTGAALDRTFRMLADSGLRVRMMREEKESLEEVFLRSIRQEA